MRRESEYSATAERIAAIKRNNIDFEIIYSVDFKVFIYETKQIHM